MKFSDIKKATRAALRKGVVGAVLALTVVAPFGPLLGMPVAQAQMENSINYTTIQLTASECARRGGTSLGTGTAAPCRVPVTPGDPNYAAQTDPTTPNRTLSTPEDPLACTLSNPSVCLASVVYAFTVGLGSGLAYVAGFMFDTTVALSLNSSAYALSFLSSGWTTARDLANMAFILILVYIAFMIMFQAETAGTIRTLAWVIFIALIINFSFFFTRVVIDVGNILAVQFYNSIGIGPNGERAPTLQDTMNATSKQTGVMANTAAGAANMLSPQGSLANTKDLTFSIMQALNIQELFSNQNFKSFAAVSGFGTKFIVLSFIYLMVGACYFILAAMFFAVAIKFIVRVVVLWFLIIASPLAFICKAVPRPEVSAWYDKWQHELVNHAFYPAFFLFIFFFISTIMSNFGSQKGILSDLANSLNAAAQDPNLNGFIFIASAVANVGIRLGFVVAMLYIALKASEYMGVRGAQVAQGITTRIGGLAKYSATLPVRGAFGAAAWTGRNVAGRAGYIATRSTLVNDLASNKKFAGSSVIGRPLKAALGSLEKASFDIRGTSVGKNIKGVVGEAGGKGGFKAQVNDKGKNIEARAKEFKEMDEKMIRKAQSDYENNEYAGGKSAFDKRKDELIKKGNAASKAEKKELSDMQGAGKKMLDEAAKKRIKAFGERMGQRNWQNIGFPSRGALEGSAKALKLINDKSKDQKLADAVKEATKDDDADTTPAAAAPASGTSHPLTRQAMDKTRESGPLSASTEKLERSIEKLADKLDDTAHEFKVSGENVTRGFSGLRKTVQEVIEKNGNGSRNIIDRGRSGRPTSSAPTAQSVVPPAATPPSAPTPPASAPTTPPTPPKPNEDSH